MSFTGTVDCGPCKRDNKNKLAVVWCRECDEALCPACRKAHGLLKAAVDHYLLERSSTSEHSTIDIAKLVQCSLHGLPIESFCNNHTKLCCKQCVDEGHLTCKDLEPIAKAAEDTTTMQSFEHADQRLENLMLCLSEAKTEKGTNVITLQKEEHDIKISIEQTKSAAVVKIKQLAEISTNEVHTMAVTSIEHIKDDMREMELLHKRLEDKKKTLKQLSVITNDIHKFILVQKIRDEISIDEKQLRETFDGSNIKSLCFKEDVKLHELPESFGNVKLLCEPSKLTLKPLTKLKSKEPTDIGEPQEPNTIKHFQRYSEFDVDTDDGFVSGLCITEDDLILLCIRGTNKVLLYSLHCKASGEITVNGDPFNVTTVPETDKAVIAFPEGSKLQIVDTDLKKAEDIIQMPESCWAVAATGPEIFTAGGFQTFFVLNLKGEIIKNIPKPSVGRTYSLTFADDKYFFCSDVDCKNGQITCISQDGKLLFSYENTHLRTPIELVADHLGNIYICDLDSNNVQRVSPTGEFLDVPIKGSNVNEPRSICFSKRKFYLAVANDNGKSVSVFESILENDNDEPSQIPAVLRDDSEETQDSDL